MATEITSDATVEIPADAPVPETEITPPVDAAPAPKPKPPVLEPEVGIEKLKKQLEDEQRSAREATARAQAAEAEVATARAAEVAARSEAQTSNLHAVNAAITAVTQAMDTAEAAYAEALAVGDHARAAKLNREMNQNAARLQKLEDNKTSLEAQPKSVPRPAMSDVERIASQLSPRSAAWIRAHPEYASGQKYKKVIAADELVFADGIQRDSDEYFAAIEDVLKINKPVAAVVVTDPDPETAPQQATGGRQTAPAAAPVSRGGNGNGSKPRTMKLTPEMQEMAANMGMTVQEYAKYRQQLIDEGQIH